MSKSLFDASRLNAFSFDPDELVLIEDEKHPLYDARVKLPLPDAFVDSVRRKGVVSPVVVRRVEGLGAVVLDGRQRVKAARVVKAEGVAIMVPAIPRKGDELDAYEVTVITNEQRQDDPLRAKILKAQHMAQMGHSAETIAADFGVSTATVGRWMDAEPKKTVRKRRGKSKCPSKKEIVEFRNAAEGNLPSGQLAVLDWILGRGPRP